MDKELNKTREMLKKILFDNEYLMALGIKDNGFEAFNQNGSKYYINVEIALFKIIEWVFDNYGVYLSIQLGEDSSDVKWWTCDFKYKDEIKSFYSDKNYMSVVKALEWLRDTKDTI